MLFQEPVVFFVFLVGRRKCGGSGLLRKLLETISSGILNGKKLKSRES